MTPRQKIEVIVVVVVVVLRDVMVCVSILNVMPEETGDDRIVQHKICKDLVPQSKMRWDGVR